MIPLLIVTYHYIVIILYPPSQEVLHVDFCMYFYTCTSFPILLINMINSTINLHKYIQSQGTALSWDGWIITYVAFIYVYKVRVDAVRRLK